MNTKGYFSNLQNRYSANFVAFISFLSLMLSLGVEIMYAVLKYLHFGESYTQPSFFSGQYILSTAFLGITVLLVIFPLSVFYLILLKTKKIFPAVFSGICILVLFISFFIIFIKHYNFANDFEICLYLLDFYFHHYKFLLPIFIAIPILCFIDGKKNILVSNYSFVNNELYIVLTYVFFVFFWLQYIPFVIGLILYFAADLAYIFSTIFRV